MQDRHQLILAGGSCLAALRCLIDYPFRIESRTVDGVRSVNEIEFGGSIAKN